MDVFEDDKTSAYIKFDNGILQVTTDEVKMISYSELKEKGAIWESHMLPHKFTYTDEKGLFEIFVEK